MTTKNKNDSWTEPEHLDHKDHDDLKLINKLYKEGKYMEAMNYARNSCDTIIREQIPPDIWLKMGGTLTPAGEERLRELLEQRRRGKGGRELER